MTADLAKYATAIGLDVTADLWRVGGVFGGEGVSFYEQNGGLPCTCDDQLEPLIARGVDMTAEMGFTRMFWDEASLQCPGTRRHADAGDDASRARDLIDRMSQRAVASGLSHNVACVCARPHSLDATADVASMGAIDGISVAPYPFHPQSTSQLPYTQIVANLALWFNRAKASADKYGVEAQAWAQGFNISKTNERFMQTYVDEIIKAGIGNIALWTYQGGADIPDLNSEGAMPAHETWDMSCRLMQQSRSQARSSSMRVGYDASR